MCYTRQERAVIDTGTRRREEEQEGELGSATFGNLMTPVSHVKYCLS